MPIKTEFVTIMNPKETVPMQAIAKARTVQEIAKTAAKTARLKEKAADKVPEAAIVAAKASNQERAAALVPSTKIVVPVRVNPPLLKNNQF
jgi:hypothetical protein